MKVTVKLLFTLLTLTPSLSYTAPFEHEARFIGKLQVELEPDYVTLLNDFSFVDTNGKRWTARKGLETDGASIPRKFWLLFGTPLQGKYVKAAVLHDQYCEIRTEPSDSVHEMFYQAMIASDVSKRKAQAMFVAVDYDGPKWNQRTVNNSRREFQKTYLNRNITLDLDKIGWSESGEHDQYIPIIDIINPNTELYKLCKDSECTKNDLIAYQEEWVIKSLAPATKVTDNTEKIQKTMDYINQGDRSLLEVINFMRKL